MHSKDTLYAPTFSPMAEFAALRHTLRLPRFWRRDIPSLPRGSETIICIPGYRAGDWATRYLRSSLSRLGHQVHGWGLGKNHGRIGALLPPLQTLLQSLGPEPITLVGWSLGGGIARELARRHPNLVAHVVTLGTPVVGGPKYTATAASYLKRGMDLDRMAAKQRSREAQPVPVPLTVIYSENDRFVCPAASIDSVNSHAVHHVVNCSHTGLVLAPEVHQLIALVVHQPPASPTSAG